MGKISNELGELIKTAMKSKDKNMLQTVRNIKAKFLEFKTSPEGIKKLVDGEITNEDEISLINKMIKERNKDIETYNNRQDLITEANNEIAILETFVPKSASEEDIEIVINMWISQNGDIQQKEMGQVIKYVKEHTNNANGSTVAKLVKSYIK